MKLSPKKGGHGHVTSYTINIGCAEARRLGFVDEAGAPLELEKRIDETSKTLVVCVKKEGE